MHNGGNSPPTSTTGPDGLQQLAAGVAIADRFVITGVLGKGGMCTVYKAEDRQLSRVVAVKVLHQHLVHDKNALVRFDREAKAISALEHPNIIRIFSFGSLGSKPYMVTEYLEGTSLADFLSKNGPLGKELAVPIFLQICDALAHAHAAGIVHRDLKPSNVMLIGPERNVKVVDFGVANIYASAKPDLQKLTQTAAVLGTPLYMSPEQCTGAQVDGRSDIYSMGCLMYEVLHGSPPFTGSTVIAVIHSHSSQAIPESIPIKTSGLRNVIHQCLEKSPSARPQSAVALRQLLLAPESAIVTSPVRWRRVTLVTLGALLAVGCGLMFGLHGYLHSVDQTRTGNSIDSADPRDGVPAEQIINDLCDAVRQNRVGEVRDLTAYIVSQGPPKTRFQPDELMYASLTRIRFAELYDPKNTGVYLDEADKLAGKLGMDPVLAVNSQKMVVCADRKQWEQALVWANKQVAVCSTKELPYGRRYALIQGLLYKALSEVQLNRFTDAERSINRAVETIGDRKLMDASAGLLIQDADKLDSALTEKERKTESLSLCAAVLKQAPEGLGDSQAAHGLCHLAGRRIVQREYALAGKLLDAAERLDSRCAGDVAALRAEINKR
jgi:hypothetical protein